MRTWIFIRTLRLIRRLERLRDWAAMPPRVRRAIASLRRAGRGYSWRCYTVPEDNGYRRVYDVAIEGRESDVPPQLRRFR